MTWTNRQLWSKGPPPRILRTVTGIPEKTLIGENAQLIQCPLLESMATRQPLGYPKENGLGPLSAQNPTSDLVPID